MSAKVCDNPSIDYTELERVRIIVTGRSLHRGQRYDCENSNSNVDAVERVDFMVRQRIRTDRKHDRRQERNCDCTSLINNRKTQLMSSEDAYKERRAWRPAPRSSSPSQRRKQRQFGQSARGKREKETRRVKGGRGENACLSHLGTGAVICRGV